MVTDSKTIYVGKGKVAVVDASDYELVSQYSWHISRGYAVAYNRDTKTSNILMHRLILDPPFGMGVDHINHDRLDNRRSNLRFATRAQNILNNSPFAASGFKGVYSDKSGGYVARITKDGKSYYLGYFTEPEKAAHAYNDKAMELFGTFAYLNPLPA